MFLTVALIAVALVVAVPLGLWAIKSLSADDEANVRSVADACRDALAAQDDAAALAACTAVEKALGGRLSDEAKQTVAARARGEAVAPDALRRLMLVVSAERTASYGLARLDYRSGQTEAGAQYASAAIVWDAMDAKDLHDAIVHIPRGGDAVQLAKLQGELGRDKLVPGELEALYPGATAAAAQRLGFTPAAFAQEMASY
jgi:hypothetical protein